MINALYADGGVIINTTGDVYLDCSGASGKNIVMGGFGEGGILLAEVGTMTLKWVGAGDPCEPYPFTYEASDFTVKRPEPNVEIYTYGEGTGIVETAVDADLQSAPAGYYTLTGQRLPQEPAGGIYIILYDNGTAVKAIKH
jgi:hypothetical protein